MQTVAHWLEQVGFAEYAELFERNAIDLDLLSELTDTDLEKIGVHSLGHRKRLLKAIATFNETRTAPGDEPTRGRPSAGEARRAEAERRQLTVLFCDLVGSTALSQVLDPEELRKLMQMYQRACGEVIERYERHVAQYLGDGLMVYFGWPRAHEDDAVRAIRAGLEVVRAVSKLEAPARLETRVGIHTGLVVVGETGHGDASIPKAAVGETPNVAARLQTLAEPGSVLVSERTRTLAEGLFDYVELGAHTLKGLTNPLRLFRVGGARAIESRFEASRSDIALTPLVGREEEVALLLRRWREANDGEGQGVLLGGEPGVGKSRLARALRERLAQDRYMPLRYQCSPYHLNSALYPVIDQLERAAALDREDTAEQRLDKLEAMLAGSAALVAESAPLFAALLSLPLERYAPLNLSPQKQKERTLEALARQVEALAEDQPLLIVYEDVHWVDATSEELLDLLVPRLQRLPVLLIVTYRPEYTPRWSDQPHVTTLGLNRLGRRQGSELVNNLLGGRALPEEVLDQILAHTDGVPLFIEELTKSVLESGLLREDDDRYVLVAPLSALAIPTTLRDSLIARLDRLAPIREIAQIGACIGREFSYELVAALCALSDDTLRDAMEQLTASGLVFRRGTPPDATYTFKHALVQDAAYDSLLKSRRSQLHAQIAAVPEKGFPERVASEPEVLAHHFMQAGMYEAAVPYWKQAGQRALARVALPEAVAHLTAALTANQLLAASVERDLQELDIRLLLGAAYLSSLGWAAVQVLQTLEPARALAIRLGEHDKLVPILYYIWFHHLMRCKYSRSRAIVGELHEIARSRNDANTSVIAGMTEALLHWFTGDPNRAREAELRMRLVYDPAKHAQLAQTYNHDPKCLMVTWGAYWLWALGYPDQARQAALEQLELARYVGHPFNLFVALSVGTVGLTVCGDTQLARQWLAEANTIAQEHAMTFMAQAIVPFWDGYALIAQGDYAEGYAALTVGAKGWRDTGPMHLVPLANIMLARALIGLQRFDEARALLEEALAIIKQTGHRSEESEAYRVLGELQQLQTVSDVEGAEAAFLKALEVARSQDARGFELRAAISLARLWDSRGRRREAYDTLAPLYRWFTEGFDTIDLRDAKALLDKLA
jgi:class 3 adenylate cyclase/tetratricopeptide (TPR) repeat protein